MSTALISIDGVVTEVWFKSPHIRIFVEVTAEDGSKVVWNTHGHNPSALRRRGWVRDTLEAWRQDLNERRPDV